MQSIGISLACCCKDLYRESAGQQIVLYRHGRGAEEEDEREEEGEDEGGDEGGDEAGEAENEVEEHAALMDCEMEEGGDVEEILSLIDGDAETEDEGSQVFYGPEVPPEMAVHDAAPRSVDSNSSGSVPSFATADFESQPSSPECVIVSVSSASGGGEHVM